MSMPVLQDRVPLADKLARWSIRATDGSGCLLWTGSGGRYGKVRWGGKNRCVSRIALEQKLGRPIQAGMLACHIPSCRNTRCFAQAHLYEGTHHDNTQDAVRTDTIAHGARNGGAKLSADQVFAIRDDARRSKDIAADYGIYFGHVEKIKRHESWCRLSRSVESRGLPADRRAA